MTVITLKLILLIKKFQQCVGFEFLLILDIWGISFHPVVVFGQGKNLLFKSILGRCGRGVKIHHLHKKMVFKTFYTSISIL